MSSVEVVGGASVAEASRQTRPQECQKREYLGGNGMQRRS